MTYGDFLETLIKRGIAAAKADYVHLGGSSAASAKIVVEKHKLDGAIDAFEACRNKLPTQLVALCLEAASVMSVVVTKEPEGSATFWYSLSYLSEIEWICDVVSAMLVNKGSKPLFKGLPTVKGNNMARRVLFVEKN